MACCSLAASLTLFGGVRFSLERASNNNHQILYEKRKIHLALSQSPAETRRLRYCPKGPTRKIPLFNPQQECKITKLIQRHQRKKRKATPLKKAVIRRFICARVRSLWLLGYFHNISRPQKCAFSFSFFFTQRTPPRSSFFAKWSRICQSVAAAAEAVLEKTVEGVREQSFFFLLLGKVLCRPRPLSCE